MIGSVFCCGGFCCCSGSGRIDTTRKIIQAIKKKLRMIRPTVIFFRRTGLILFIKMTASVITIIAPITPYPKTTAPPSRPVCFGKVSPATNAPKKKPPVKLKIIKSAFITFLHCLKINLKMTGIKFYLSRIIFFVSTKLPALN